MKSFGAGSGEGLHRLGADPRASWAVDEAVVAVDESGARVGEVSRAEAHSAQPVLHRAFMVLLHDESGRLLLCRRSAAKRLWPSFWADSCAGHPHVGEPIAAAAVRRVREELNAGVELSEVGAFVYRAQYEGAGTEWEYCHVFTGEVGEFAPDPAEVSETDFVSLADLRARIARDSGGLAPWLVECVAVLGDRLGG